MLNHTTIQKIGNSGWVLGALLSVASAQAGEVQFSASIDHNKISLEDTVSLKIVIRTASSSMVGEPHFDAPDFEVVNDFKSISMSSQYDSTAGGFTMINSQQITKVLRPLKLGNLRIADIQLTTGGKVFKVPDITVQVVQAGSGGPLSQNPNNPAARGRRAQLTAPSKVVGTNAIVRAETGKSTAYKGEQIIVSYYLYHQSKIFNIQVEKFPVLSGFLREDLEMPVMGQRLESEQAVLNGVTYNRSLLARYAAYPLEEGKLGIDSISLKFNYYSNPHNSAFDEEDPFFGFFQQLSPRVGSAQSERLNLDVIPLPEEGRPESFVGGVGDFNITSAIDKYEVHANDAVTLTVKIEGHGNVATIKDPKPKWPEGVELYDTKGRSQSGRAGVGEKVFEFLLIPRVPGKLDLPPLEFGFFDPVKKQYYVKTVEPIHLNVLDAAPGTTLIPVGRINSVQGPGQSVASPKAEDVRYLKPPSETAQGFAGQPLWRFLYWGCLGLFGFLVCLIGSDLFIHGKTKVDKRRASRSSGNEKTWDRLHASAQGAMNGAPWQEVTQAYELLTGVVFDSLDSTYQVGVRSISRPQLKQILVEERGLPPAVWGKAESLLEFADLVRFASSAGAVSENTARNELSKWVGEGEKIVKSLASSAP